MKKRVALLLAAVMSLSMMSVNVFAATNNYVDNRVTVPDGTAVVEHGLGATFAAAAGKTSTYLTAAGSNWGGDPSYYVDGTDLVLPLQRSVTSGYQFKLTLTNAKWYFRSNGLSAGQTTTGAITDLNLPAYQTATYNYPPYDGASGTSPSALSTYDTNKGAFYPNDATGSGAGIYYRDANFNNNTANSNMPNYSGPTYISGVGYVEVPYTLEVSSLNDSVATITIKGDNSQNGIIRIPLVTYISDSNVEATVTVDPGNSSTVTAQKLIFANTANTDTNSTAASVKQGRDEWDLDSFIVSELRVGTILPGEIIKLSLPYGYHFGDLSNVKVGLEKGLTYGTSYQDGYMPMGTMTGPDTSGNYSISGGYYYLNYGYSTTYYDKLTGYTYYGSSSSSDDTTLWIYLGNINPSDQLRGSVYVDNLNIWADDNAPMPTGSNSIDINMHVEGLNNITTQDVLVAQRVDWALGLSALSSVPTLVTGRYIGASWSGMDADDNTHRTADVQLYETAVNSWWGSRSTILTLPATDNNTVKGAKFRKVTVDDYSNISDSDNLKGTYYSQMYGSTSSTGVVTPLNMGSATYLNDGERHGCITVNDNTITLTNLHLSTTDTNSINFHLWVSLEYGFGAQTGDLVLTVDPNSSSLAGLATTTLPTLVIAHVVDPVTVSTTVSDLKIGYQYQTTSDIQIQENGAGYLLQNKTVKVSITDQISSDMYFTNDTKIQVTSGDLKIKNITTSGTGGFTSQSASWLDASSGTGTLSFDIDRPSSVASTITISNIAVKLDRTVPVTNKSAYNVVVWGTAIAENYGLVDDSGRTWKSDFDTAGAFMPYINVISAAPDQASILTQEVRVTIGESYYVVNGQTFSMDAVAYISPASNSTMVPVRFVANAFGLRDDQIIWDDANKTATINAPNKVIQFKLDSSTMIVNGVPVSMQSPDGLPVVAEIKTINGLGRMYLPFRALGNAFGVPVDWDASTQTAIYNNGANSNGTASISNTTPVVNS